MKTVIPAASTLSYSSLVVVYSRMLSLLSMYAVGFPLFSFAVEMKGSFDEWMKLVVVNENFVIA